MADIAVHLTAVAPLPMRRGARKDTVVLT